MNRRDALWAIGGSLLVPRWAQCAEKLTNKVNLALPAQPDMVKVFDLPDPYRVVVDVSNMPLSKVKSHVAQWDKPLELQVRVAQNTADKVRIVISVLPEYASTSIQGWFQDNRKHQLSLTVQGLGGDLAKNQGPAAAPRIIVLDPGHGGLDPGAIGVLASGKKIYEKDIVLEFAKRVQQHIDALHLDAQVHLTRTTDQSMALRDRVSFARTRKADMLLSLHADSVPKPTPKGASLFVLSEGRANTEFGRFLADSQNKVDFLLGLEKPGDPFLEKTLLSLAQSGTSMESKRLAKNLLKQLKPFVDFHSNIVNEASFAVLTAPDVPSALMETGFVSNEEDLKNLTDPDYLNQLASYTSKGVAQYIASLKKPE